MEELLMYTKDTRVSHEGRNQDLHEDIQKVKDKLRETKDALSQTAHDARSRAEELLSSSLSDVKEKTADIQENVVTYVRENPVKAIGFAVLAGAIVAQLLRK
jgi:ElaB/YqjD/DUF883 family membrane-anchored ribosome-binding protein